MRSAQTVFLELNDPRYLQIFLLGTFLTYGIFFLDWDGYWPVYAAALSSVLLTQALGAALYNLPKGSWKSALISGLGLCLLLKVNFWYWMALAGIITIAAKFIIKKDGQHIYNPTNLGIIVMVALGMGWISPGQWGSGNLIIVLIILGAGGILLKVQRWDVALSFLVSLFLLEAVRVIFYLGWGWDVLIHRFSSGTLLLFAFFMITDPKTTPHSRKGRIFWGIMVALLSFLLSQFFYLYQAPLIALFAISTFTPFLNKVWSGQKFQWILTQKP